MTIDEKFTEEMAQRSDAELLEIVTKLRDDYQPDAVKAAEAELEKRNLTPDEVEQAEKEIETKSKEIEDRANAPLLTRHKIRAFLIPGGLIGTALFFKLDGYHKRSQEAWRWTFYGFAFYLGLVILLVITGL